MILSKYYTRFTSDITSAYQGYLVGRLLVNIIVSIVLVKGGMTTYQIGTYEWYGFLLMVMTMSWSSGVSSSLISYNMRQKEIDVVNLAFWMTNIGGFTIASIVFLSSIYFNIGLEKTQVHLLCLSIIFFGPLPLIESVFVLQGRAKTLTLYGIISNFSLLLMVVLGMLYHGEINTILSLGLLHLFFRWMFLIIKIMKGKFHWPKVKISSTSFFKYCVPICLTMFFGTMMDMLDGFLVKWFYDSETFAIFRYGARELPMMSLIFASISTSLIPSIQQSDNNASEIKVKATRWMHIFMPIGILLMCISPYLFSVVYSDRFVDSALIFNTYLLIMTSRVLLPQSVLQAVHRNAEILHSTIFEIIINLILSLLFMYWFGLIGLALGTVFAFGAQKIYMMVVLQRFHNLKMGDLIDTRWYMLYSCLLFAVYGIVYYLH